MRDGTPGMIVGRHPPHGDDQRLVGVPRPALTRHVLFAGTTGSGKTTSVATGVQSAHAATDGATVIVDPKGDIAAAVARGHYGRYGALDDVLFLDAAQAVPRIAHFDLRPDLARGRERYRAAVDVVEHTLELIRALNPTDQAAARAPMVIRHLLFSLFSSQRDTPNVTSLSALLDAVHRLRRDREVPAVDDADAWNAQILDSITDGNPSMFDTIMQGVTTRVEFLAGDPMVRRALDYAPSDPADSFRFDDYLDTDRVIIIDLSGIHDRLKRTLAHVVLSELWRALVRQRRGLTTDPPIVSLVIDEAAQLRVHNRLADLLTLGRSFGLAVTLVTQRPGQLAADTDDDVDPYEAVINNTHSVIAGRVLDDDKLIDRLAVGTTPTDIKTRLAQLPQTHFLAQLAKDYDRGVEPTRVIANPPPPHGHPAATGDRAFTPSQRDAYRAALDDCIDRTTDAIGRTLPEFSSTPTDADTGATTEPDADVSPSAAAAGPPTDNDTAAADATGETASAPTIHFATTLPYTTRLPEPVVYDDDDNLLYCAACSATDAHPPTRDGLYAAIRCCNDIDSVDRDNIPPVEIDHTLPAAALTDTPYTKRQLLFCLLVHHANAGAYDSIQFDRVFDSHVLLRDYAGFSSRDAVDPLLNNGVMKKATRRPSLRYWLTDDTFRRDTLGLAHPRGDHWGHGHGDLNESAPHQTGVDGLARHIHHTYVTDPDSPVTRVVRYLEPSELDDPYPARSAVPDATLPTGPNARLDVAGLDDDGTIHVAGEVEVNAPHAPGDADEDTHVVKDYCQLVATGATDCLWVVATRDVGHDILTAIATARPNDPTYAYDPSTSAQSPLDQVTPAGDGLTTALTLDDLRTVLPAPGTDNYRPHH